MKNNVIRFRTQYNMTDADFVVGIDYTELVTVPDLVLSMEEIYLKYAVRGDISGLANNINPHVQDNLDLDDPSLDVEFDEDVDVLQYSRELRSRQHSSDTEGSDDSNTRKTPPVQGGDSPGPSEASASGEPDVKPDVSQENK